MILHQDHLPPYISDFWSSSQLEPDGSMSKVYDFRVVLDLRYLVSPENCVILSNW